MNYCEQTTIPERVHAFRDFYLQAWFRNAADLSFPEQVALSLRWADAENCARMKFR